MFVAWSQRRSGHEGCVDREVISRLFCQYFEAKGGNQQAAILEVISRLLQLDQEQRVQVGLWDPAAAAEMSASDAFSTFLKGA